MEASVKHVEVSRVKMGVRERLGHCKIKHEVAFVNGTMGSLMNEANLRENGEALVVTTKGSKRR